MKLLIIVSFLFSFAAMAGNEKGNGSDAVVCYEGNSITNVSLLDYFEGEIYQMSPQMDIETEDYIELALSIIERIKTVDVELYRGVRRAALLFKENAYFANNSQLVDIDDSFHAFIPNGCKLEQLIIMRERPLYGQFKYTINNDLWEKLSLVHKAGAVIHESIYGHFLSLGQENSLTTRSLNNYISSNKIKTMSLEEIMKLFESLGFLEYKIFNKYGYFYISLKHLRHFYPDGKLKVAYLLDGSNVFFGDIAERTIFYPSGAVEKTHFFASEMELPFVSEGIRFMPRNGVIEFYNDMSLKSLNIEDAIIQKKHIEASGAGWVEFYQSPDSKKEIKSLAVEYIKTEVLGQIAVFNLDGKKIEKVEFSRGGRYIGSKVMQDFWLEKWDILLPAGTRLMIKKENRVEIDPYFEILNLRFGKQSIARSYGIISFQDSSVNCLQGEDRKGAETLTLKVQNKNILFDASLPTTFCFYKNSNLKSGKLMKPVSLKTIKGDVSIYRSGDELIFTEEGLVHSIR